MADPVVVRWMDLVALGPSGMPYREAFDVAIQETSFNTRLIVDNGTAQNVHLLIATFLTSDFALVNTNRLLETRIGNSDQHIDELLLICCGRSRPSPRDHEITGLINDQVPLVGDRQTGVKALAPEDLKDLCERKLLDAANRLEAASQPSNTPDDETPDWTAWI